MDDEILRYKQRLEEQAAQTPIWEKACLTIEEAAEYTGCLLYTSPSPRDA